MSAWQPIETAPLDGTPVLLGLAGHHARSAWWDAVTRGWIARGAGLDSTRITAPVMHWQPMPEPPEATP